MKNMNNFMIPIALSGDRSYNRDNIRRYVMEGSRVIPGSSSIHFDEISKKRIFSAIDRLSIPKKLLKEKYFSLKNKLGRIPTVLDFYQYGEIDPLLFIKHEKSYHEFLKTVEDDYMIDFSQEEERTLEFVSSLLLNGKRPHELIILKYINRYQQFSEEKIREICKEKYNLKINSKTMESAVGVLTGKFVNTQTEREKYKSVEFIKLPSTTMITRLTSYTKHLHNVQFQKQLQDLIELGLLRYEDIYSDRDGDNTLTLYQKYSRKDICRLLNWERDDSSTIYGHKIKNNTCPIFVTYEKKDDIASSTKYEDRFVNNSVFSWMTRS